MKRLAILLSFFFALTLTLSGSMTRFLSSCFFGSVFCATLGFTVRNYLALGKPEVSGVYVGSLDSLETKRILASDSQAVYAYPGYLLFLRQGILLAQRFDPGKLELSGDPLPQAEHVATTFTGLMAVSAADIGPRSGSEAADRIAMAYPKMASDFCCRF